VSFEAITSREASIFACAADTLLGPQPELPAVHETSAAAGFDQWLACSPAVNRLAVRAGLYLLEISPVLRFGRRFRALSRQQRKDFLHGGKRRPVYVAAAVDTLRMLAAATYYGDDAVAKSLGYDADVRLERGRKLRAAEGRP
jgi:hypothetical protein